MLYKVGKKFFLYMINLLGLTQVGLVFFAFITVLYWILDIAKAPFVQSVTPFFESIRTFTHQFYNRNVNVDQVSIDFSYFVFAIVLLFTAWAIRFLVEMLHEWEDKYDALHKTFKRKVEERFNSRLEKNYVGQENKNKKFLVLIKFLALDAEKEMSYKEKSPEITDAIQMQALRELAQVCVGKQIIQKKIIENSLLLYYNDFENMDNILLDINKHIEFVKTKYRKEKWILNFLFAVEPYISDNDIMEKYKRLRSLHKLDLRNEMICLGTFKMRYSLVYNAKYVVDCKGLYNIDSGQEEVFRIKRRV